MLGSAHLSRSLTTMLKLGGFPVSNYYNKIKIALLEKEIPFEELWHLPSQDPATLAQTPMGKVPFLVLEDGQCLSEGSEERRVGKGGRSRGAP